MTVRGYFRGHLLIWTEDQEWLYADTLDPAPVNGGKVRPCKKCGALFPLGEGEVDPCLGILPEVDNACCGHGVCSQAYIRFINK
jgi:hypothetical protein